MNGKTDGTLRRTGLCLTIVALLLAVVSPVWAEQATAYIATVHGNHAFDILDGGNRVYFHPQPDTAYAWNENNGSPDGTIATYNEAVRDGMKTYAATDIGYGYRLDQLKLEFDCYLGEDTTGFTMIQPGINIQLTDGSGNYASWSPSSGGTPYSLTPIAGEPGWNRLVMDCTGLSDAGQYGQMNEYNGGGLSDKRALWSEIRDWTIAGFYDFMRSPEGEFGAWSPLLWGDMTEAGLPLDATPNQYGIILFHGDTVGGMLGDGEGEIGIDAGRAWAQGGRMARNVQITLGTGQDATTYDIAFAAAPLPLPPSMVMMAMGLVGVGGFGWLKRRRH